MQIIVSYNHKARIAPCLLLTWNGEKLREKLHKKLSVKITTVTEKRNNILKKYIV